MLITENGEPKTKIRLELHKKDTGRRKPKEWRKKKMQKITKEIQSKISNHNYEVKNIMDSVGAEKLKYHTSEYINRARSEAYNKIFSMRDNLSEDVETIFIKRIGEIEVVKEDVYMDNNPEKTTNVLKMIELIKDDMTIKDFEYIYNNNIENKIVIRTLLALRKHIESRTNVVIQLDNDEVEYNIKAKEVNYYKEGVLRGIENSGIYGIKNTAIIDMVEKYGDASIDTFVDIEPIIAY